MSEWRATLGRARDGVAARLSIDTRSLAVFRIMMGILVLADVVTRLPRFAYFYTEAGVVPQSLAMDRTPDGAFSLYFFTTNTTVTAGLFLLQAIVGVLLIAGFQTRVMAVIGFLLVVSLSHRNPLINSYADRLFRLLMFWAMFLPMGERWSVDAAQGDRRPRPHVGGIAAAAILVQMIYMYLANGLQKRSGGMWSDGAVVPIIFGLDDMTYPLADRLRAFPELLELGGIAWYLMLLASPLLVILPGRWRMPLIAMFLIGHFAFAVTVRIGSFGIVAIAGVILFVPAIAWSDGRRLLRAVGMHDRLAALGRRARALGVGWAKRLPTVPSRVSRDGLVARAGRYAAVVSVAIVLVMPAVSELNDGDGPVPEWLRDGTENVAATVGVHQPPWTVFAPRPRSTDRWYVFAARTADGEQWDAYNDRPLSFDRPYHQLQRQYRTYRERFYMNSVRRNGGGPVGRHLAEYLCEQSHEKHDGGFTNITFYTIAETVTLETIDAPDEREQSVDVMFRHRCASTD